LVGDGHARRQAHPNSNPHFNPTLALAQLALALALALFLALALTLSLVILARSRQAVHRPEPAVVGEGGQALPGGARLSLLVLRSCRASRSA